MNPSVQIKASGNIDRCFFGEAPTLGLLKQTYGENMALMWLIPQLCDLAAFSNSKNLLNEQQTQFIASVISQDYGFLKTSELMLFFYRFKAGHYGHFYGAVDGMRILEALREFLNWRFEEKTRLAKIKEEQQKQKDNEEYTKKTVTWDEFKESKGLTDDDFPIRPI